jgi:hypothetical protein
MEDLTYGEICTKLGLGLGLTWRNRDNISHLFYPEYNRKIEVSKVKIVRTYFLSTLKSSKKRARRNSTPF